MYDYALYGSSLNTLGTLGLIALVLAIAATVLAFIFIVPSKRRDQMGKFGKFLHDTCNFRYLIIEKILQALYIFATALTILIGFFMLFCTDWNGWMGGKGILLMILGPIGVRVTYELLMMAVLMLKNVISINNKLRSQNGEGEKGGIFTAPDMSGLRQQFQAKTAQPKSPQSAPAAKFCGKCGAPLDETGKCPNCDNDQPQA